jgi:uncharacterized membrane protein
MTSVVQIAHVLCFGVAAGIWIGVIVTGKSPRKSPNPIVFIEWIQGAHAIMKWFMPTLLALTFLSGVATLFFARRNITQLWLTSIDLVCLMVAIAVTRIVEVPIVNGVAQWSSAQSPADWSTHRNRWMRFHAIRAIATFTGFTIAVIGLVAATRA